MKERMTLKEKFGKYEEKRLILLVDQKKGKEKVSENEDLLGHEKRGIERVFDEHHIFKGSLNGNGEIFYFYKNHKKVSGLRLVFRGKFLGGMKHGYGASYYQDDGKLKFEGMFKENFRDGKGTECSENGKYFFVGEWKMGNLCRVIWNNRALDVIDLDSDVKLGKLIYPKNLEFLETPPPTRIYEGVLMDGKKECVVKVFQTSSFKSNFSIEAVLEAQKVKNIKRNLKILTMFQHPHIVKFYGWSGEVSNTRKKFGYVMEKCSYSLLELFMRRKRRGRGDNMELKKRVLYQTAMAMEHLSKNCGLIHRDLKCTNILTDNLGNVRINDFDFAIQDDEEYYGSKNKDEFAGSVFHIAPDVFGEDGFNSKSDVYSFGIVMFEVLFDRFDDPYRFLEHKKFRRCNVCGKKFRGRLNDGMALMGFMRKHLLECDLRPVLSRKKLEEENEGEEEEGGKDVEDWLIQLMENCWRKNPKKRYNFSQIVEMFGKNTTKRSTNRFSKKFDTHEEESSEEEKENAQDFQSVL